MTETNCEAEIILPILIAGFISDLDPRSCLGQPSPYLIRTTPAESDEASSPSEVIPNHVNVVPEPMASEQRSTSALVSMLYI